MAETSAAGPAFGHAIDLDALPGYCIRRLNQIAVAIFLQETEPQAITPVQYGCLQAVANTPGMDQRTLARTIGIDTSTIGGVVDRLEARGLLERKPRPDDRRVRLLSITSEGLKLLRAVRPGMLRAQQRMLDPLTPHQREQFMQMLRAIIVENNAASRAPSEG